MSGDSIHDGDGLNQRLSEVSDRVTRLQVLSSKLAADLKDRKAEVQDLNHEVSLLTKVEELFRALIDQMVVKQVRVIEDIVTQGFQTIFYDQDLSFEAEVTPKYNKVYIEFYIRKGSKEDPIPVVGRPEESFGGGPTAVASLILRVLATLQLKRSPFILLDEALGAVGASYVENTGKFLNTLCSDLGLHVLMVTHRSEYLDHADNAYRAMPKDDTAMKLQAL